MNEGSNDNTQDIALLHASELQMNTLQDSRVFIPEDSFIECEIDDYCSIPLSLTSLDVISTTSDANTAEHTQCTLKIKECSVGIIPLSKNSQIVYENSLNNLR